MPWWSLALTGVLYSPSNQQGEMLTYKSTLVKTKLYYIVHQHSCTLLYILSLPLMHPTHRQLPTTSNHFTKVVATSTSCMRSPSWFHCISVALPTASQTIPSFTATNASSFLNSFQINPNLSVAQRIASIAPKKTLLDHWNQPSKPFSLLDALSSVGILVPYGRPRFGTMGSNCTLVPNTLIASLVCASLPTTQIVKEFPMEWIAWWIQLVSRCSHDGETHTVISEYMKGGKNRSPYQITSPNKKTGIK